MIGITSSGLQAGEQKVQVSDHVKTGNNDVEKDKELVSK